MGIGEKSLLREVKDWMIEFWGIESSREMGYLEFYSWKGTKNLHRISGRINCGMEKKVLWLPWFQKLLLLFDRYDKGKVRDHFLKKLWENGFWCPGPWELLGFLREDRFSGAHCRAGQNGLGLDESECRNCGRLRLGGRMMCRLLQLFDSVSFETCLFLLIS